MPLNNKQWLWHLTQAQIWVWKKIHPCLVLFSGILINSKALLFVLDKNKILRVKSFVLEIQGYTCKVQTANLTFFSKSENVVWRIMAILFILLSYLLEIAL